MYRATTQLSHSVHMSVCRALISRSVSVSRIAGRPVISQSYSLTRGYATTGPTPDDGVAKFLGKIQSHPEIMEELKKINDLMVSKKLVPPPEEMVDSTGKIKRLTMAQQMKIFMDSDVRKSIAELGKLMATSGVDMNAEDLKALGQFMQQEEASEVKKDDDGSDSNKK